MRLSHAERELLLQRDQYRLTFDQLAAKETECRTLLSHLDQSKAQLVEH